MGTYVHVYIYIFILYTWDHRMQPMMLDLLASSINSAYSDWYIAGFQTITTDRDPESTTSLVAFISLLKKW